MKRLRKVYFRQELLTNENIVPWWYGFYQHDYSRAAKIFYPIPLNILLRFAVGLYWRFANPLRSGRERELNEAYARGRRDGWKAGVREGKVQGYNEKTYPEIFKKENQLDTHLHPAECIPTGEHILDEMKARGWSIQDLASKINEPREIAVHIVYGTYPIEGDVPDALAAAFGTSAEYWSNLEKNYQECLESKKDAQRPN